MKILLQEHIVCMRSIFLLSMKVHTMYFKMSIFSYSRVVKGVGEIDSARPPQAPSKVEHFSCPYLLLDIRDADSFEDCHIITGQSNFWTNVYRVIFALLFWVILPFYTCKTHPVVNLPRHSCVKKEIFNLRHLNSLSLKFTH